MKTTLSEEERKVLHHYNIFRLLTICRKFGLPHAVHSTSITFYKRLFLSEEEFSKDDDLKLLSIILLACKSEDIHGDVNMILEGLGEEERQLCLDYETTIAQTLHFDFHIPSPYLKMLGIILILQERERVFFKSGNINYKDITEYVNYDSAEIDNENINQNEVFEIANMNDFWDKSVGNMDKIYVCDDLESVNTKEAAVAALHLPLYLFEGLFPDVDIEKAKYIRKEASKVRPVNVSDMGDIFFKAGYIK